jgi:hypothetical protein
MALRLVDKDRQIALIDKALASNRLEDAAEEFITLLGGKNIKHVPLMEEGHIGRILDAIAQKEPSLAIHTAERALKILPVLTRAAVVGSLLACAESIGDADKNLALKALTIATKYSSEDPEQRDKTAMQLVGFAGRWKDTDAKSAFEVASGALALSTKDAVLRQTVDTKVRALNIPGMSL